MNAIVLIRNFSVTTICNKNASGRFMQKVMKGNANKRKWATTTSSNFSQPNILTTTNVAKANADGTRNVNSRRVNVLNKMFMRYITDLMATGDSASEFLGRGIEINRVMVASDFSGVNVYWVAKGTENDEKLEQLLNENAHALRHELTQLRVMGVVPKINFVKDKEFAKLMEVDLRLAKADFGEDHVVVDPSYLFKSLPVLKEPIPQHLKEKIQEIDQSESEEFIEEELPPMRNDMFGLNHSIIMHRIVQMKKKSQALHRKDEVSSNNSENSIPSTFNEDPVYFESQKKQMEAFHKFLAKRQILKAKANRTKDKSYPEYEFLQNYEPEILDNCPLANDLLEHDNKKDYIEEIEDYKKI